MRKYIKLIVCDGDLRTYSTISGEDVTPVMLDAALDLRCALTFGHARSTRSTIYRTKERQTHVITGKARKTPKGKRP